MGFDFIAGTGTDAQETIFGQYRAFRRGLSEFSDPLRKKEDKIFIPANLLPFIEPREVIAFMAGIKPAFAFNIPYSEPLWSALKGWCNENKLSVAHADTKFISADTASSYMEIGAAQGAPFSVFVAVADSQKKAKETASFFKTDPFNLGKELGYPDCCIDAAVKFQQESNGKTQRAPGWDHALNWAFLNSKSFSPYLNSFHHANLISHCPCTLNCKKSIAYSKKLLVTIKKQNKVLGEAYDFFRGVSSLHWNYYNHILFQGEKKDGKFVFWDNKVIIAERSFPKCEIDPAREKIRAIQQMIKKSSSIECTEKRIGVFMGECSEEIIKKERPFEVVLAVPNTQK